MKVLFSEIRSGDLLAVSARLAADPRLARAVAKAPPKKDDGQSTLQVAIKAGQFEMAELLLDRGADAHFMDASALNRWNMPVLHDAVRASIFSSRFGVNTAHPGGPPRVEIRSTLENFMRAFGILERLLVLGASTTTCDSFGNPALMRAVLDTRQVLNDLVLPDRDDDLRKIFQLLLASGADPDWVDSRTGRSIAAQFASDPVGRFLVR